MRLASLTDVEGASSWDADSVRVLAGSGHLYILTSNTDTRAVSTFEEESEVRFIKNVVKMVVRALHVAILLS